jgi:hypothetical protein
MFQEGAVVDLEAPCPLDGLDDVLVPDETVAGKMTDSRADNDRGKMGAHAKHKKNSTRRWLIILAAVEAGREQTVLPATPSPWSRTST